MTKENKRALDEAIHEIIRVNCKNCPSTWRGVKETMGKGRDDRKAFILALKRIVGPTLEG